MKITLLAIAICSSILLPSAFANDNVIQTNNAFYQENVNAQGTWKLNLKSTCALNLANINEHLSLEILGYVK
jgi:cytochrome oxidase Cu insertion factor (SCO1/SenC/PrrC family)